MLRLLAVVLLRPTGAFEEVPCNVTTIDCGVNFFREVYQQFQTVQSEVVIMPFFIEPELKIFSSVEGSPPDTTLQDLILRAVRRKVHVWILGWENAASEKILPYHQDSRYETLFRAAGEDHPHLHLMLDTGRNFAPSVFYIPHIKSYSFDRRVAYVGGIDFSENRRDTPQHVRPNPLLVEVKRDNLHVTGNEKPWQDAMVKVDGPAAEHIAMILIERWWTYCRSPGFLRSQASRPLDALADALWKVDKSLRASDWKNYQCRHLPQPARLGVLEVAISAGASARAPKRQGDGTVYAVEAARPQVQSQGLEQEKARMQLNMTQGTLRRLDIPGLRALDSPIPEAVDFTVQGVPFVAPSDRPLSADLADGSRLTAQWLPNGVRASPRQAGPTCKVVLSGDSDFMGTSRPLTETLDEYIRIIRGARKFIYIENQYFSTDFPTGSDECRHSSAAVQGVLYSGATNRIGEVLLDRIKRAGRLGENFSVAVVIPLATEPGSFYPNLRGCYCFEQAVESYWRKEGLKSDWRDYFSFFFIANAVAAPPSMGGPGSAFYGIFTHTKAIIADNSVAILGSANINDRSMNGDRDAEVGVKVVGAPFPKDMLDTLMLGHIGDPWLVDQNNFTPSLRKVAEANARELREKMGISFPEGTVTEGGKTRRLFAMKSLDMIKALESGPDRADAVLQWPLSRQVAGGGGMDHFKWYVVPEAATPPRLKGLLFPWSRDIWGLPKYTSITQIVSPEFNWRRLDGSAVEEPEEAPGPAGAPELHI